MKYLVGFLNAYSTDSEGNITLTLRRPPKLWRLQKVNRTQMCEPTGEEFDRLGKESINNIPFSKPIKIGIFLIDDITSPPAGD